MSTSAVLEPGSKARTTRKSSLDGDLAQGVEFEIEDYVGPEDADDGIAFYWGSRNDGCNNVVVPADAVELIMSKTAMAARAIPTPEEISSYLASEVLGSGEGFSINETDRKGMAPGTMLVSGQTNQGLYFGFELRIHQLVETDF